MTATTVFVSGATGYIAQNVCKVLLQQNYRVIGTVRSDSKGEHLKQLFNSENFDYEIVEDVGIEGAFDKALQNHPEATVFLHTASPFHFRATDIEKELLAPAVKGTQNALKAIKEYGKNITNVVITSSYAAVSTASVEIDPTATVNEDSWNAIQWDQALKDVVSGYRGSKTFAERAAWDFVKQEKPNFALTSVNPSFVFGPQAYASEIKDSLNTSSEIINSILKLGPDGKLPPTRGGFVDVRDVAKAHVVAFEKPEAHGKRLVLNSGRFSAQTIVDVLNNEFEELKGKIPVGVPGSDKEAVAGLCKVDTSKTELILGFDLIDIKTSVIDTVRQILDARNQKL